MDYSCFNNKVVVITGGAGELGGGTAVEMARWGAKLAILDIHQGRLTETMGKISATGLTKSKTLEFLGDCTKQEDVDRFVNDVITKFGRIDHLIHVVGTKRIKVLQNMSMADLDWCIDGNIKSVYLICKACVDHLKASKGTVVTITSVSGGRPVWGALPYAMCKAAVDQFTRCVSQELAPHGVRVNTVAPGALKSRFNMRWGDIFTKEEQLETYFDVAGRSIPIGFMGDWTHVVPTIMFLASDKSAFVTGAVVPVDGGYVCTSNVP